MILERNRFIALSDGVRLTADIYRPDGGEAVPALVGFSAFGKEVQALSRTRKPLLLGQCLDDLSIEISGIDFWVTQGYAVVLVNPRGISTSQGIWQGLFSRQDQQDCYAAIEWAAWQDWCDKNVGMLGCGTAGRIQPLVAAMHPPHLKAIMPIDLVDDLYQECYPGGVLSNYYLPFTSSIPVVDAVSDAERELSREDLKAELKRCLAKPEIQEEPYLYRTLDTFPPRHFPFLVDVLLHDRPGSFWEKRSHQGIYGDITIPLYAVTPCYEFGRSTWGAINAFRSNVKAPRKLLLLGHGTDRHTPCEEANGEMLRWYDHWLKGKDTGILEEPPVRLRLTGTKRERCVHSWPPAGTAFEDWYLSAGNALTETAGEGEADTFYHEPPIFKSQFSYQLPALRYTTVPFAQDSGSVGPVSLTLYAAMDQSDGCFIAKLWDKAANGMRLMLSNGVLRASCRKLAPLSHPNEPVNDLDGNEALAPGEIYEYTFGLNPICHVFQAGHCLELEIKACDAQSYSFTDTVTIPRLFSSGLTSGALPSTLFTHYTLYHDPAHPSRLTVPVTPFEADSRQAY